MAQKQSILFKAPASAANFNYHIAKIIAPGPYSGLEIVPTEPRTMKVGLTAGYALTDEGVKIEETADIGINQEAQDAEVFLTIDNPEEDYPRRDLIVLRHRFRTYADGTDPSSDPNIAHYVVIKGTPTPLTQGTAQADEASMQEGDIPLAEIQVNPGMTAIDDENIYNRNRTLNATDLLERVARAMYIALGNFIFEGWDQSYNALNVTISPGTGLIAGIENTSTTDTLLSTLRAREYLRHPRDYTEATGLYDGEFRTVGVNLTLDKQPDYPSKLTIKITPMSDVILDTTLYVSGIDGHGNVIDAEPVVINCPVIGTEYTFTTANAFAKVNLEGIDAHLVESVDPQARISICDNPVAYLYAIGTNSGRPIFEAVYSKYEDQNINRLYLGYVVTDETNVIDHYTPAKGTFSEVIQVFNDECTGANKTFILDQDPVENSEMVVLDGLVLMKDSPSGKGYTIQGKVITLQENVPAPDGTSTISGSSAADLWVKYRRIGG